MRADEYHQSLCPIMEACERAETGWVCLPNPLVGWGHEGAASWKLRILFRHIALLFRCWRNIFSPHILVREFSTLPLLLVFPLIWPLRRKLLFLIHHNLQWALRSRVEAWALSLLAGMGARWVLFETQEIDDLSAFNIPSKANLVLPHPVFGQYERKERKSETVICVAGNYRPEKGMDELLHLLKEQFPRQKLIVGVPNPEAFKEVPAGIQLLNTAADVDYRQMLCECDVLVQNGKEESYFYRVSGPVADAAASGTAVVAPDFPLLRHQITSPLPVGEVFHGVKNMPEAVRLAVENVCKDRYDFGAYCAARSAQALAKHLDEFSHGNS